MADGPMHYMGPTATAAWGILALLVVLLIALAVILMRREPERSLLVSDLIDREDGRLAIHPAPRRGDEGPSTPRGHETIFVLPDISGFTRFMTGSRFSTAHAEHIVFALINAMILAATRTIELSKLEGDAALFYVDADRHTPDVIGQTILDIFSAFFSERHRLMEANLCPCRACRSIGDLDLKIFVHRGRATRFRFRGSVDHFGSDVIVLHRLMKNGLCSRRYVMVTEAAAGDVRFPEPIPSARVEEAVEQFGVVRAHVFDLDEEMVGRLTKSDGSHQEPSLRDTAKKLRANLRSVRRILRR